MPLTLRELVWAARGKEYSDWERTAELWAVIAEANRNPKIRSTPFRPTDLFRRPGAKTPQGARLTAETFRAMRSAFIKPRD